MSRNSVFIKSANLSWSLAVVGVVLFGLLAQFSPADINRAFMVIYGAAVAFMGIYLIKHDGIGLTTREIFLSIFLAPYIVWVAFIWHTIYRVYFEEEQS